MTDMAEIVHSNSTNIYADLTLFEWLKILFLSGCSIIESECHLFTLWDLCRVTRPLQG